jgi:hypothetical protein
LEGQAWWSSNGRTSGQFIAECGVTIKCPELPYNWTEPTNVLLETCNFLILRRHTRRTLLIGETLSCYKLSRCSPIRTSSCLPFQYKSVIAFLFLKLVIFLFLFLASYFYFYYFLNLFLIKFSLFAIFKETEIIFLMRTIYAICNT